MDELDKKERTYLLEWAKEDEKKKADSQFGTALQELLSTEMPIETLMKEIN